jgi:hypothetical protein
MKFTYDNEADIPAELKAYYAKGSDGKWHLQCDGAVSRVALNEFRDKNVELQKEIKELKEKFQDIDPEKAKELLKIENDLKAGKLTKDGKTVEQIVEERVGEMRKTLEKKAADALAQNEKLNGELSTLRINDAVLRAATAKGLRETAADDIIARARTTFRLVDGQARAFEEGDKPRYNKQGQAYGIEDFVEEQLQKAAHLFKENSGTGAGNTTGAGAGNGAGTVNPWKKETKSLTLQGKILKENPQLATRMAAEAGVKLTPAQLAAGAK